MHKNHTKQHRKASYVSTSLSIAIIYYLNTYVLLHCVDYPLERPVRYTAT